MYYLLPIILMDDFQWNNNPIIHNLATVSETSRHDVERLKPKPNSQIATHNSLRKKPTKFTDPSFSFI